MNITDQKIVSYLKGAGTSWLNKFEDNLTFGQLINLISEQGSVVLFEEHSDLLDQNIKNVGFCVNIDVNITGVVLENGQMIRLSALHKNGKHHVIMEFEGEVPEEWKDQFEELKKNK